MAHVAHNALSQRLSPWTFLDPYSLENFKLMPGGSTQPYWRKNSVTSGHWSRPGGLWRAIKGLPRLGKSFFRAAALNPYVANTAGFLSDYGPKLVSSFKKATKAYNVSRKIGRFSARTFRSLRRSWRPRRVSRPKRFHNRNARTYRKRVGRQVRKSRKLRHRRRFNGHRS